jgi:hypothetical protein
MGVRQEAGHGIRPEKLIALACSTVPQSIYDEGGVSESSQVGGEVIVWRYDSGEERLARTKRTSAKEALDHDLAIWAVPAWPTVIYTSPLLFGGQ